MSDYEIEHRKIDKEVQNTIMGKVKGAYHGIAGFLLLALTFGSSFADPNSPKVRDVSVDVNQGTVQVAIQADKPVQVRTFQLETPRHELVFDIYPSVLLGKKETKPVGQVGVADIRVAQFSSDPDVTRVVVDLDSPVQCRYKMMTSEDRKEVRIALMNGAPAAPESVSAPESREAKGEASTWRHARVVERVISPQGVPLVSSLQGPPGLRPTLASPSLQTKLNLIFLAKAFAKKKKVVKRAAPKQEAVSFSWKNADLTDVIRSLADRMRLNVIVDTAVKGSVTLDLRNVPAGQALGMILAINGYSSRQIGNILVVGPSDKLDKLPTTPIAVGPQAIQVIPLENAKPGDLRDTVASEYPEVKVEVDSRTNSLLVKGPVGAIRKVKQLVSDLDKPVIVPSAIAPQREVIRLNYSQVKDVLAQIKPLLPSDAILIGDDRMNSIIVSGSQYAIETVKSFVAAVDVPSPQVMLEMQVLSVNETASRDLGIEWPGAVSTDFAESAAGEAGAALPTAGGSVVAANSLDLNNVGFHTFVRDNIGFKTTMHFLVQEKKAKLLGAPRIATINGKEATIHLGDHVPIIYFDPRAGLYQAQYIDVGVILKITPVISPDGTITIHVNPQVSQITGFQQNFPQISSRDADTTLRVRNGETIVLGGLLQETNNDAITKIPFLGDIPILGEFFRHRTTLHDKTDLIISITPTLLANR